MKKRIWGFAATAALAAGDPTAGKAKSAVCAACHNADGNSTVTQYPKLAGQSADYLVKQLQEYKSGARVNAIMVGMVAPLSPQDMEDLAAYFSSQQVARGAADPALAPAGEVMFRGGNLTSESANGRLSRVRVATVRIKSVSPMTLGAALQCGTFTATWRCKP